MAKPHKNIAIITTIFDDWGGSEELWAKSIAHLKDMGVGKVTVYKNRINFAHPQFLRLQVLGVELKQLLPDQPLIKKAIYKVGDLAGKFMSRAGLISYNADRSAEHFHDYLEQTNPALVIIAQAINFDGLHLAYQCLELKIPYMIIMQKAVDFYWPDHAARIYMKKALQGAEHCFFVSEHNKTLTEEQFGVRLPNSKVVFNPVKTNIAGPLPYPATDKGFKLACIGRLFIIDKGQDILLRIMALPKWRERDISVSIIGSGTDTDAIKEMAALLGLTNVDFIGYAEDIEKVWSEHHALVLPSRSEGLPLVITEAMAIGRVVITTRSGGSAELITHGVNGFVAEVNERSLDEAMEQAWQRREEWEHIGIEASRSIKERLPEKPEKDFASEIVHILDKQ
ncbi:glycosyltransferase [Mucilaginibacter myungsuensis]|uniref:Glycosyltransferase n=1 Tax=Mucilaginibacter myungsuensis TaxID=649104 RepID=A0A929L439_9SPHI|nr:glycosyltransferase [Mucilaginibacter myungsuensis]MBE9664124.1 glycosyltransferase [Mucilaginibacter myungsuensis]MDN3601303.1 glycosyltransferase [Mucilaginibacter myungsuensis]